MEHLSLAATARPTLAPVAPKSSTAVTPVGQRQVGSRLREPYPRHGGHERPVWDRGVPRSRLGLGMAHECLHGEEVTTAVRIRLRRESVTERMYRPLVREHPANDLADVPR